VKTEANDSEEHIEGSRHHKNQLSLKMEFLASQRMGPEDEFTKHHGISAESQPNTANLIIGYFQKKLAEIEAGCVRLHYYENLGCHDH
jgi:hypothetical protein